MAFSIRILFILYVIALSTLSGAVRALGDPLPESLPNGISAGDTTLTSTVLWARSEFPGGVVFEVSTSPVLREPVASGTVLVDDPAVPAKFPVEGLQPGERYFYRVTSPIGESLVGTFRTAKQANRGLGPPLRFGVTGDWRGELSPYPGLAPAVRSRLDFFVKLGDTIYADFPSPAVPEIQATTLEEFRAKHNEVYAERFGLNAWAELQATTSVFAVIDDHEVTNDFAGGASASSDPRFPETTGLVNETILYQNGLQAFSEYNAIEDRIYDDIDDPVTDGRPDLYRSQVFGDLAAIFLLDARSFRDQELPPVVDLSNPAAIGAFVALSFDINPANGQDLPPRTMLSQRQLERLKDDLLAADDAGVTWKFVFTPEPIQNLGVLLASDRFEGYAAERSDLLQFIDENAITNVVFVAADIHGTLVNNLTYQRRSDVISALANTGNPLAAPQIETGAFEITTGSLAFDPPLGPALLGLLAAAPGGEELLGELFASVGVSSLQEFLALPDRTKNTALQALGNELITTLGYSPLGLDDAEQIDATLTRGLYVAAFTFGWTEFVVTPARSLRVTTFGIEPYGEQELLADPAGVVGRRSRVVSQFRVQPSDVWQLAAAAPRAQ